jgi:hypothetical protein
MVCVVVRHGRWQKEKRRRRRIHDCSICCRSIDHIFYHQQQDQQQQQDGVALVWWVALAECIGLVLLVLFVGVSTRVVDTKFVSVVILWLAVFGNLRINFFSGGATTTLAAAMSALASACFFFCAGMYFAS